MKKIISVKGIYDCNGGVQEVIVEKTIYQMTPTLEKLSEVVLFDGDIKSISETDDEDEIKEFLKKKFTDEGFITKVYLK